MRWHGVRIEIVVAALVVALGAFLGTQWLYSSLNFQKPLQEKLENNSFVAHYEIEKTSDEYNITITPRSTDNLMEAYNQLYRDIEQIMGTRTFTVQLNNQHHDLLNNVFNQGQFAIYEAMAVGNFTDMEEALNGYAQRAGMDSRVFMDKQNIYWQLSDGKGFIYNVVAKNDYTGVVPVGVAKGR